jgi:type I restriction enzyme S subunit
MVELITNNIDIWTSAQTIKTNGRGRSADNQSLHGIKKLRELILELAVRGKLVPQDRNDEPASALLERIAKEKALLIKTKEIKNPKVLPEITDEEKPFPLPSGWQFVRLNHLGEWGAGATPARGRPEYYGGAIPWFKSGELVSDYISSSEEHITELALKETSLRYNKVGDVLIAMYGATIGKTSILTVPATTNQAVCACTPFSGFANTYLLTILKAYKGRFIGMGTGGAQPNISREKLIATVIALPPFAEQKRIVAKVDELMALCDQLERRQTDSNAAHQTLVEAMLATLTDAADQGELEAAWQRIANHFDTLFTTEHSIDQLKQTILQLAVMGKLVPQDPNDEPASVLLERIEREKARLIREGKIKSQNELSEVEESEKPFELPMGWAWVRWDRIALKIGDIDHKMPDQANDGYPYVSPRDFLPNNGIDLEGAKKISKEDFLRLAAKIQPQRGDIIYPRYGTIGENRLVETEADFLASYSCCVIKTMHDFIEPKFQFIFSVSMLAKNQAKQAENKTTQANVGIKSIQNYLVPLPPYAEQHRIVAKVDELMTICDTLKARLNDAQTAQIQLADAIVERAVV